MSTALSRQARRLARELGFIAARVLVLLYCVITDLALVWLLSEFGGIDLPWAIAAVIFYELANSRVKP